jgi:uncharacterized protein YegP (UPF0339 family)
MNHPKFRNLYERKWRVLLPADRPQRQNILSSQGYASKAGCQNGIESVKNNGTNADRFEVKEATNGKFFFNLLAANKQVIGKSQMYATPETCQGGIEAVQRVAAEAGVEDTTARKG